MGLVSQNMVLPVPGGCRKKKDSIEKLFEKIKNYL